MTLTYLHAIMNMRAGLRRGNIELIVAAKSSFAPMFHSRNHPKYRYLEMVDQLQRCSVPDDLIHFFNETESVSLSGDPNGGEGLDFKAESVNKDVQSWMPRGVPEGQDWLRVTRNLEKLKKIALKSKEIYSIKVRHSEKKKNDVSEQVAAWRVRLRGTKYLSTPCDNQPHTSITGKELDESLIHFQEVAIKRRQQYFDVNFGNKTEVENVPVICITKEERHALNDSKNQSKSTLCDNIENLICSVIDEEFRNSMCLELQSFRTKISKTKRDTLLGFLCKVKDVIDEQELANDNNTSDIQNTVESN